MAVGVPDHPPVPDGWARVERSEDGAALGEGGCALLVDLGAAPAPDPEVGEAAQPAIDAILLDQNHHERAGAIAEPYDALAGALVTPIVHDLHRRVAPVEVDARVDVGDRERDVGQAAVDGHEPAA